MHLKTDPPKSWASTFFLGMYWTCIGRERSSSAAFLAVDTVLEALDSATPTAFFEEGAPALVVIALLEVDGLPRFLLAAFAFAALPLEADGMSWAIVLCFLEGSYRCR